MSAQPDYQDLPHAHSSIESHAADDVGDQPTDFPHTQPACEGHIAPGVGDQPTDLPHAQGQPESQESIGVGDHTTESTDLPHAQPESESQVTYGVGDSTIEVTGTAQHSIERNFPDGGPGPILADPTLALYADILDDIEHVRCANENRLRILTTPVDKPDSDGKCRGHGLTLDHPDVARLAAMVATMYCRSTVLAKLGWVRPPMVRGVPCCLECQAVKNLERALKSHPLSGWVSAQQGVGAKQGARLLASLRDPYWHDREHRPRRIRELRAYCGLQPGPDGVALSRHDGTKAKWNHQARKRVWLVAASCLKQADSPYRKIYDETRVKYDGAVHEHECLRCGPKGKPAQPGSPLPAGHQHGRAMRAMCRAILDDLWNESRRIHLQAPGAQLLVEGQCSHGAGRPPA